MGTSVGSDEKERHLIARNIRVLMALQDVTVIHLAHVLTADKDVLYQKINGKRPFSEHELRKVAKFFNTSYDSLLGEDVESHAPDKYNDKDDYGQEEKPGKKLEVQVEEEAVTAPVGAKTAITGEDPPSTPVHRKNKEQSGLVRLIRLTEDDAALKKLLEKTYLAILLGKIGPLEYYLRNNLLAKALHQFETAFAAELTEEEKEGYVSHYLEQYEEWKRETTQDDPEVMTIRLLNNKKSDVLTATKELMRGNLRDYWRSLLDLHTISGSKIEIGALVEELNRAAQSINDTIVLLDTFEAS